MGTRPRIAKLTDFDKLTRARRAVRELYVDAFGYLTDAECDNIIQYRQDGLGFLFITDLITKKRESKAAQRALREQLFVDSKKKS